MERYEYGTWKVEGDIIFLQNRKFRMKSVTSVYYVDEDNLFSLVIKKDDIEFELVAPDDLRIEMSRMGKKIADEAQICFDVSPKVKEKLRLEEEAEKRAQAEKLAHEELEASIKKLAQERAKEEARKEYNRTETKKKLEDVISLNEGVKKNQIAVKLEETADKIEIIGKYVFYIILGLAVIDLLSLIIVYNSSPILFDSMIFPTILTSVVTVGVAFFEMFVYKCVALQFRAYAEMVQNTYISANVALYSANTNNK